MLYLALLSLLAPLPLRQDVRPDVLILVADDISERDMDRLETPTFDALAARGLRFRRAYANPTCSPSRWSITFGQYHTRDAGPVCDGYKPHTAPSTSQVSLPKVFARTGYRTALFGKWHLGSHPGVREGEPWEDTPRLHGYETWRAGLPVNSKACGGTGYRQWLRVDDGVSALSTDYITDAIRDAFLGWHAEVDAAEEPWFAMVCFQSPHTPLHRPPVEEPGEEPGEEDPDRPPPTRRELFEAQVRYLDTTIASMLAPIDLERTLVIFLADNGTGTAAAAEDQDPSRMKATTYEPGIRVPMVWAGAGVPAGAETDSLAHLVDLLPTLAELVGAELPQSETAPKALDGASLLPLLESPERAVREYVWSGLGPNKTALLGDFTVVSARFKLRRVGGKSYLFDLDDDPHENVNLAGREQHREVQADLEARLERHLKPVHQPRLRPARDRGRRR